MSVALSIDQMTKAGKIGAMEALWDDLCRAEDEIESPAWHGDILRSRKQAVESGAEKILDWEDAKQYSTFMPNRL